MSVPVLEPVSVKHMPVPLAKEFQVMFEAGAKMLGIRNTPQGEVVMLIQVNPSAKDKLKRTFRLFLSGEPLGPEYAAFSYVDSFVAVHPVAGPQLFHCFEVPKTQGVA